MEPRRAPRGSDRRLLGELLIEAGLVSRSGLQEGLEEQQLRGGRLGYTLLKTGRVTPAGFYLFLQDHLPAVSPDLVETLRSAPAVDLIPARLAYHYGMVPIRVDDGVLDLAIATADAPRLVPSVEALTGLRVEPLICPPALIAEALARSYPAEVEAGVIHRAAGDSLFVLADRRRGLRPLLPESVREDARPADWLRAIVTEGIRRGARRVILEPRPGEMSVAFRGALGDEDGLGLPRGAYPGVAALLDGLSGIASRGRVIPREGRLILAVEGRRIAASVLALPGLDGETYTLDLREEQIAMVSAEKVAAEQPDLPRSLATMVERRTGLLLLAGPGPAEAAAGLSMILALLGERLPRRIALGDWDAGPALERVAAPADEEEVPFEALLAPSLARAPELLVLPEPERAGGPAAILALARERVVVAPLAAVDACDAAEMLVRSGHLPGPADGSPIGILGIRLMEQLCRACARPYDLHDLLSPWPPHRRPPPGIYATAQGCAGCRGSGQLRLGPVFEFLPVSPEDRSFRPGLAAGRLRERRAREGKVTLLHAALREAASGAIDVKEPLRLLLHEQH